MYMFKRDRRFYIILFVMYLVEMFGGNLIYQMREFIVGPIIATTIIIPIVRKVGRLDEFLLLGITRKHYYILNVIYDFLFSALSSVAIVLARIQVDGIPESYFNYIFLFYIIVTLVLFSTSSFNQIFGHSDYSAVRIIVFIVYVLIYFTTYSKGFSAGNFTNFNKNLVSDEDLKLKEYYITCLIIIGFNYITSYLVHKNVQIKAMDEVE